MCANVLLRARINRLQNNKLQHVSGKYELFQDLTLMVQVAPKDYVEAGAAMSRLPAEEIYWINSKTVVKYESFTEH